MFYGVSHVEVPVRDLTRAQRLYGDLLGFREKKRGEGFIDLDAGTIALRLLESPRPERRVSLRVEAPDVAEAMNALVQAGCKRLYEPQKTPALELVASVVDPDGHTIQVWRDLLEDEYDFTPPLPKDLVWQPEAEALMQSLLRHVPAFFRPMARPKVVRTAEWLAQTTRVVTRDEVVRGFILANAKITRFRAREPLLKKGIDPDDYRDEFEAD